LIRSDGTLRRDYVHVQDAVSAYEDLAAALVEGHQHGEAFNFGTGVPVSVLDLVSRIREAVGSNLEPIVLDDAPHEIQSQWLDSSKAKRELGWSASLSLPEGLAQTVPWYLELLRS
jgi:nucleoside-diphosphate-sugar epimerase